MSSRVLVVDDEPDLVESLGRLLRRFGYTCLVAASGAEAMDLIRAELPALVVTDLHMPGVDGLRVARCARQQTPPIPVVLMTAYPPSGMTREAQALGGTVYLAKPFANADLLDAVRSALGPKTAE